MSDGAARLFSRLTSYQRLKDLIDEGESESSILECKAPTGPTVNKGIRSQFARAASAFANAGGGVIIWGLATTQHDKLDVITEIRPIGNGRNFQKKLADSIYQLTIPSIIRYDSRLITRRKSDTRGIVVCYIPQTTGDPIQSAIDNVFYFRAGQENVAAPYTVIQRLFATTATPDLTIQLGTSAVTNEKGLWILPIHLVNRSSAIAEHTLVELEVVNPTSYDLFDVAEFDDASDVNDGVVFFHRLDRVVHRGPVEIIGAVHVRLKEKPRRKRRLDLQVSLYANHMRARKVKFILHFTVDGCQIKSSHEGFVY